jgi:acetyl-CoA carboxylase biotin carboxyl carrier protein
MQAKLFRSAIVPKGPATRRGNKEDWAVELDKIQELMRIFSASDVAELEIEEEGRRIVLKKQAAYIPVAMHPAQMAPAPLPTTTVITTENGGPHVVVQAEESPPDQEGHITINSPMVGVFYTAPSPGEPPFVGPGDTISVGQTVCIVEAMKLMNEVTAKEPVKILRVLVENGEPVEFDQPLFLVEALNPA